MKTRSRVGGLVPLEQNRWFWELGHHPDFDVGTNGTVLRERTPYGNGAFIRYPGWFGPTPCWLWYLLLLTCLVWPNRPDGQ